jgi:hypothetical protein
MVEKKDFVISSPVRVDLGSLPLNAGIVRSWEGEEVIEIRNETTCWCSVQLRSSASVCVVLAVYHF